MTIAEVEDVSLTQEKMRHLVVVFAQACGDQWHRLLQLCAFPGTLVSSWFAGHQLGSSDLEPICYVQVDFVDEADSLVEDIHSLTGLQLSLSQDLVLEARNLRRELKWYQE